MKPAPTEARTSRTGRRKPVGDLGRAPAAVSEVRAHGALDAHRRGHLGDRGALGREIRRHRVDRDDRLDAVHADVLQLLAQVRPKSRG
jgi:hypothetical protein